MENETDAQLGVRLQQLEAELHDQEALVQAYLNAARSVLGADSFEQVARQIFDAAIGLIGATSGYVALLSEKGDENEVLFLEAGGRPCTVDPSLPMPIRGLREIAYRTQGVAYENDFMHSEWVKMMPGGHVRLDNVLFAPLNVGGRTVGIMGMANKPTDFTPRDAHLAAMFGDLAAIALQRAYDQQMLHVLTRNLQRSNEDLQQFAYVASHDLFEPLRSISGFLALLEKRYQASLDEIGREFIHFAVEGAARMRKMVEGLLTFSRLETQEKTFNPVDMNAIVRSVLDDLHAQISERQACVHVDSLPRVAVDSSQLRQLWQNLISNAIRYNQSRPPRLEIGCDEKEQEWEFRIADNGIGFDSELYQDKIFQMFKRIDPDSQAAGCGIGLALCRKIVERHGGRIWATSEPGNGSCFYFTLPRPAEAARGKRS
ncbi:sensor histidine kinase [Desulfuromonas thiophila]|nr:ATP-binding protein [Desulfuromonas thiophila]